MMTSSNKAAIHKKTPVLEARFPVPLIPGFLSQKKFSLCNQENFLPSGLYRRHRNSTGSIWSPCRENKVAGYTADREFHPTLKIVQ